MGKIICVFNQKGGVGKTTTVVNLAAALGLSGSRVLVVDMDPQGNSTSGFGVDKAGLTNSVYDLLLGKVEYADAMLSTDTAGVDIIPSTSDLAGLEVELVLLEDRELRLKNALQSAVSNYEYIFVDCPPSLGQLSINSLVSADSVLIPIQCEFYALEGVSQLMSTIDLIRSSLNPRIEIEGVLISMFDGRNNLAIEVVEEVKRFFKHKVFKTVIPRNIRVAEAPSYGQSVIEYDEKSKGAIAYMKLAKELHRQQRVRS